MTVRARKIAEVAWGTLVLGCCAHRLLVRSSRAYRQANTDVLSRNSSYSSLLSLIDFLGRCPAEYYWLTSGLIKALRSHEPVLGSIGIGMGMLMHRTEFPEGTKLQNRLLGWPMANFREARLAACTLTEVRLEYSEWTGAVIDRGHFHRCAFRGARLVVHSAAASDFHGCDFRDGFVSGNFSSARFVRCNFADTDLKGANLRYATFLHCDLTGADLTGADLTGASFDDCMLRNAIWNDATIAGLGVADSEIYGISVWGTRGEVAESRALRLSPSESGGTIVEVDGLHTAVFTLSLLFGNGVRDLIDGLSSTLVVVLGRFDTRNKATLNSIRNALRARGYTAILFDTAVPKSRDLSETVSVLTRLARFVIADLTDPRSTPYELLQFVSDCRTPVQAVLRGQSAFSMFSDLRKYPWVLPPVEYEIASDIGHDMDRLISGLESVRSKLVDGND